MTASIWDNSGDAVTTVNADNSIPAQKFIATKGQTVFTLTLFSYQIGTNSSIVELNGVAQFIGDDYLESSNTSITLTTAAEGGDQVVVRGIVGSTAAQAAEVSAAQALAAQVASAASQTASAASAIAANASAIAAAASAASAAAASGLNFSGVTQLGVNTALTAVSTKGKLITLSGTGLTITLPASGTLTDGAVIAIQSVGSNNVLSRAGSDTILVNGSNVTSLTVGTGDTAYLVWSSTVGQFILFGGTMQALYSSAFVLTKFYISPDQTITAAGTITLTHNFGVLPKVVDCFLHCLSADVGYGSGDFVRVAGVCDFDGTNSRGVSLNYTANTIILRFGSFVNTFQVLNATTGVAGGITNTKWALVIKAAA